MPTSFFDLPQDVFYDILDLLDVKTVTCLASTCLRMKCAIVTPITEIFAFTLTKVAKTITTDLLPRCARGAAELNVVINTNNDDHNEKKKSAQKQYSLMISWYKDRLLSLSLFNKNTRLHNIRCASTEPPLKQGDSMIRGIHDMIDMIEEPISQSKIICTACPLSLSDFSIIDSICLPKFCTLSTIDRY